MKRFMIHLVIALITFSIGITVALILTASPFSTPAPNGQKAALSTLKPPTPPPAPPNPVLPVQEFILDYDPKEFNPRGDYFILGRKPKAFREFDCFELAVDERDGQASGNAMLTTKYYGKNKDYYITTGNGDYAITGSLTKNRLVFVATPKSEEDFEFRFDGSFLKGGMVSNAGKHQAVLNGRLIKLKGGVKIAEGEVRFRVEYLGC